MRPNQWTKNVVVLAAVFFAYWDSLRTVPLTTHDLAMVISAMFMFCLVSSGIYVINDIHDVEADRQHPQKKLRPLAAGCITARQALPLAIVLLIIGLAGSYFLSRSFAAVACAYVLIQIIYTTWLKQIALLDVIVLASGFVLRAMAGAVVIRGVTISPWLLLCTFLLALFLGLCKRRHEKLLLDDAAGAEHRPSLDAYDERLLDMLIAIASAATIVSYAIYTLWPDTIKKFGTSAMGFTVPFVVFGVFRYLDLVYRHEKGGQPEKILLSDIPLLADIALYALSIVAIFKFKLWIGF
jgi:4-hydroxybenzoate polyprenyltransferase